MDGFEVFVSFVLTDPRIEDAIARFLTEIAAIKDNNGATLFQITGRGYPVKQIYKSSELPGAWVNLVDMREEEGMVMETRNERDLIGVLILWRGQADGNVTDPPQMLVQETERTAIGLNQLMGAVIKAMEASTLDGITNWVTWTRTLTPVLTQNLPLNSLMPVFKVNIATPRTDSTIS